MKTLSDLAKTCGGLALHAKARLPYISVLTHPTTGGVSASFATLGTAEETGGSIQNPAGANGLFYGNPAQFLVQLATVLIVVVFAFGVTFVLTRLLHRWMGLRVSPNEEEVGLDLSEHGERAYA